MNFEEFKTNVQQWATERGIYEHSTPEAQLMKALSELGELADAIIQGDKDGIKDGVGDIAVCLVNSVKMSDDDLYWDESGCNESDRVALGETAKEIGDVLSSGFYLDFNLCISYLYDIAVNNGFTINECFEQAWNEIKDRKGRMVPGGAFVKDAA